MDMVIEALIKPVDLTEWAKAVEFGIESDTGENSRHYLQERLFMSFEEFADSLGVKNA